MWTEEFIACLEKSTIAQSRVDEALAIKAKHLPKRIYKYRNVCRCHLNNFETGTVRLSSPESFNDPYDCWLTLSDNLVTTLIERRVLDTFVKAKKLHEVVTQTQIRTARESREPLKEIVASIPSPNTQLKKRAEFYSGRARDLANTKILPILREMRKTATVCSFSAVNDSLLMWSHYSDNHRGFCLEYDIENLDSAHPFQEHLYPVIYSSQLYGLERWAEKLVAGDRKAFSPMFPLSAMLHKFDGWQYEKEWRLVFDKEVPTNSLNHPAPKPSAIFLGSKMDCEQNKELLAMCAQKEIAVYRMHLAEGRFELFSEPWR